MWYISSIETGKGRNLNKTRLESDCIKFIEIKNIDKDDMFLLTIAYEHIFILNDYEEAIICEKSIKSALKKFERKYGKVLGYCSAHFNVLSADSVKLFKYIEKLSIKRRHYFRHYNTTFLFSNLLNVVDDKCPYFYAYDESVFDTIVQYGIQIMNNEYTFAEFKKDTFVFRAFKNTSAGITGFKGIDIKVKISDIKGLKSFLAKKAVLG